MSSLQLLGLSKLSADQTVIFHEKNGGSAIEVARGDQLLDVFVHYPDGARGIQSSIDWSSAPAMDAQDFHNRFGGQRWKYNENGIFLEDDPANPKRSPGAPITCTRILNAYGPDILKASLAHDIPPEIIVMTIAAESGADAATIFTGPATFRWEPSVTSYSAGPMQTLASTVEDVIDRLHLDYDKNKVAPRFAAKPNPIPNDLELYKGPTNIDLGTAEIRMNRESHDNLHNTGLDPILIAACYNAGSLRESGRNPWHLVTTGNHLNRASEWFGDACFLLSQLRQGRILDPQIVQADTRITIPIPGDRSPFEIAGLLDKEADIEVEFFQDSGAAAEKVPTSDGYFSVSVSFPGPHGPVVPPDPGNGSFQPPDLDGYVLCIDRVRTERRQSKPFARTIGVYQAYFNRQKLPDIFGVTVERQGPSDNSAAGVSNHRRIAADTYPMFTHASSTGKYRTIGFASPSDPNARGRPWPAIGVEETGQRSGILIHCASGYLMSIGCINLASRLDTPADNIDFKDSRSRVVALIRSIQAAIGDFPDRNNEQIRGVSLVIRDHV